jgi:hypothetical protein
MRWRWCRATAECWRWSTATVLGGRATAVRNVYSPVLGDNCSCCFFCCCQHPFGFALHRRHGREHSKHVPTSMAVTC